GQVRPSGTRAWHTIVGLATAALVVTTATAQAHPVPFSYLDLKVNADGINGTLVVHIFDAAHDLGIEPPERLTDPSVVSQRAADLIALISPRLSVTADGRRLDASWSRQVERLVERQSLRLDVSYRLDARPGVLSVGGQLFPYDPNHQTFLNVYEGAQLTQAI